MNRFKELDLVNSVPEDLWRGDCNIVQEAANTTIPEKSKKVMWLSEEALQTAKEKREPKKKKQGRKGKIYPTKCRFPKDSREIQEGLLQ